MSVALDSIQDILVGTDLEVDILHLLLNVTPTNIERCFYAISNDWLIYINYHGGSVSVGTNVTSADDRVYLFIGDQSKFIISPELAHIIRIRYC